MIIYMATNRVMGSKNPMYGKHRSDETKRKISIANAKPIIINGKCFGTLKEASVFIGMSISVISTRVRHKIKWQEYKYGGC